MDLSSYANAAEIIGTVAIVVSLVYVAIQIRQNNRHLAEEAQRARAQAVRENFRALAGSAETCAKDLRGDTLTAAESFRLQMLWMAMLFSYQTSFLQLPRKEILGHANVFRRHFESMPSLRDTWSTNLDTFRPEFIEFMQQEVITNVED